MNLWEQFILLTREPFFNPLISLANIFLLFITAFATWMAWRSAKQANELKMLPLLAIYFRGGTLRDRIVRIRNIGQTPAYNIEIQPFEVIITDIQKIWKLELSMTGTNILIPNEEKDLRLRGTVDGKDADVSPFLILHLDPDAEHKRKRIGLSLQFRNAQGSRYYCMMETGSEGLFVYAPRKLNLIGKSYLIYRSMREFLTIIFYKLVWKFRKPYFARARN